MQIRWTGENALKQPPHAADLGYGDAVIGALLGHQRQGITARCTHPADAVVLRAADDVARTTLALMNGKSREDDAISVTA